MLTLKNYQENTLDKLRAYFRLTNQYQNADTAFYEITRQHYGQGIPYHPVKDLNGLPYICLRLPTGGGKTILACHTINIAQTDLLHADTAVILWLVPSNTIREQTLNALKDYQHPYRQALDATLGSVSVLDISEALHVKRSTLDTDTTIIVSSIQAFRVDDTEGRKVYEPNGSLMEHFKHLPDEILSKTDRYKNGRPKETLANVLCLRSPIVIMDEAHNARTSLSFEMLTRFNPSCIIEFTATPDIRNNPSNVLYTVSASELYNEDMIKMPIHLTTRTDWKEILTDAIQWRKELETIAREEQLQTGEYIRPVMLIQAQPQSKNQETITFETVKKCLMNDFKIPEEQIAISTGQTDDLKDIDIEMSECDFRYIITVQKLREGWDCPFAYILCSLATMKSPTAVEQITGRILRMPGAKRKTNDKLNSAYAFAVSSNFGLVLNSMSDALVQNGFEKQEAKDLIIPQPIPQPTLFDDDPLFSNNTTVHIPDIKTETIETLPEDLKKKIDIDEKKSTLTFKGSMSLNEKETLEKKLPSPEAKKAIEKIYKKNNPIAKKESGTPSERGISFKIPYLVLKQGELFEVYEEQHFLDYEWKLSECDAELTKAEYSAERSKGERGKIEITKDGKITTEYLSYIQDKFAYTYNKTDWNEAQLIQWLDKNIPHPDISPDDSNLFLIKLITNLIQKNITIFQLVQDKYNLRNAIEKKIAGHRKNAYKKAHQSLLFGNDSKATVIPEKCFSFKADPYAYPYNRLYDGTYKFKKHYYPKVGAFGSGEETECAIFLDTLPEVDFWVRNLERNPAQGFWFQTSSDKFYPDFVCRLKNGRNFVVEYKGADRYTNEDSTEKRILGELWEEKSNGTCMFIMPKGKDFEAIKGKVSSL
ncbi:Helicase/UvrB domain-containing protein [Desulfonema limicola]|uniref:Helicase/UvrB domain-containing protein n=1 Tax=Desulfonema limicola TaxID=45656 RepID=A0A975B791_9BACT|nr:DEAD/DEAH box helicase family protein [Desulfonema limicola]QTA79835.1 Helicase/UvrB domain-containing protein [Desulfonema limicola]